MFGGIKRGIITLKANDPYLSNLISEEKDFIGNIKGINTANSAAAKYIQLWGEGEHEDITDVTKQFATMCADFSMMVAEWEHAQNEFRDKLKDIRTETDQIANTRKKSNEAAAKVLKFQKAGKPTHDLEFEAKTYEKQLENQIAAFEGHKRAMLQEGMMVQFNGMMRFALKVSHC